MAHNETNKKINLGLVSCDKIETCTEVIKFSVELDNIKKNQEETKDSIFRMEQQLLNPENGLFAQLKDAKNVFAGLTEKIIPNGCDRMKEVETKVVSLDKDVNGTKIFMWATLASIMATVIGGIVIGIIF